MSKHSYVARAVLARATQIKNNDQRMSGTTYSRLDATGTMPINNGQLTIDNCQWMALAAQQY